MAKSYRTCPKCGKTIAKIFKRCPFCHAYQKSYIQSPLRERNLKIVSMLDSGDYTLQEVADLFEISTRERVRQIYVSITNQPYALKHGRKQKILKELQHFQKLKTIKYNCRGCGKPVTFGEARQKCRYCPKCFRISNDEQRVPYIYLQCLGCTKKFHPYKNRQNVAGDMTLFHSMDCYIKYRKTYGMFGRSRTKALDVLTKKRERVIN